MNEGGEVVESEWYLKKYLHINAEINRLRRKKHLTQKKLYQQTLTTHLEYNALGIRTQAPKIEYIVSDNIKACELIERRIERWKIRKRYFITRGAS